MQSSAPLPPGESFLSRVTITVHLMAYRRGPAQAYVDRRREEKDVSIALSNLQILTAQRLFVNRKLYSTAESPLVTAAHSMTSTGKGCFKYVRPSAQPANRYSAEDLWRLSLTTLSLENGTGSNGADCKFLCKAEVLANLSTIEIS